MSRHRAIYEELLKEIRSGTYQPGDRLPSEAALCERFDASRITVAKAIQTLQQDRLVMRRPGSGTYVERPEQVASMQFGLLIPDLGTTEIFEPICQGLMRSPVAKAHSLTWGHSDPGVQNPEVVADQLCQQYIAQRVAGVFFAPMEYTETSDRANRRIAATLERAGIPVVLLDRCVERYPDRSNFDLVGIDNQRAGHLLTRHMIQAGAKRILFAARRFSASTVEQRIAGYREALLAADRGATFAVVTGDFEDVAFVQKMLQSERPDAIICANDATAARLMQTLLGLGVRVPEEIRMSGVDDVRYARFLPVPLTTIRQDCLEMGTVAMGIMMDRLNRPDHPVRDVLVKSELIVRSSSGMPQSVE
ncbi:GntR family transcriptional regulator [Granulicella tundricola]|uniref:Transcriptional regulator, GntR family with LacI sensor n=1 Tax=Granulicella tundricola (strain ATCC BAA-1859 / DSM 23138 / MP5ACTX9) TaxID=1198114 RepID=E8X6A4_GRATM|nr:GntR family transcriptional regulator [Granulicella tundricola]ADW70988.1 transcriptional regulator, GntR family with LacI sensor [Granulicella tundricola MP5ACTX9]